VLTANGSCYESQLYAEVFGDVEHRLGDGAVERDNAHVVDAERRGSSARRPIVVSPTGCDPRPDPLGGMPIECH
jgi:hypothetical protein